MNQLTALELRVFNNISRKIHPSVFLGDKLNSILLDDSRDMSPGTPTNATKANVVLNITGVVKDGEKVCFDEEVYEFLADAALTKSDDGNIGVDITSKTVKANGVLTLAVQPDSGETVTIGTKVYTFVPVGTNTADGEVSVGADLAGAKLALVAAINGTDNINTPHPLVSAAAFIGNDCTITALIGGTNGNSIATVETFAEETNIFAAAVLSNGSDCSAADAIVTLASVISDESSIVEATAGDGHIDVEALSSGIAGNEIVLYETLVNGAFAAAATHMINGADGTIATAGSLMFDANYLYLCVADNTVSGSNWRRISIGTAF